MEGPLTFFSLFARRLADVKEEEKKSEREREREREGSSKKMKKVSRCGTDGRHAADEEALLEIETPHGCDIFFRERPIAPLPFLPL
jgi:hypothetical protein